MLILLLLTLSPSQRDCSIPDYSEARYQRPIRASGKGLWIGGIGFTTDDVISMEPIFEKWSEMWALRIRFTPAGLKKFIRSQRCGLEWPMEISIDGEVVSRPRLNEPIIELHIMRDGPSGRADAEALASWIRRSSTP